MPEAETAPKKAKPLTENQKRYIRFRTSGHSRVDAYMKAYKTKNRDYASKAAHRLMKNYDEVRKEINRRMDESTEEAQATFALEMSEAAAAIVEMAKTGSKEDGVRLRAAEYIIDRGLGKPRTDVNFDGDLKGDLNIVLKLPEDLDVDNII
jgi:hypothetical protein